MWIVFESRDGSSTILSEQFGVTYHSKYGAVRESLHVFIRQGLHPKCIGKKELSILEVGFGTGLNALLTLTEAQKLALKIDYTAIEKFPINKETLNQLNYCKTIESLSEQCHFDKLHDDTWGKTIEINEHFNFLKLHLGLEEAQLDKAYDIIYFDAFAPNVQPELWNASVMQKMYDILSPKGILVTYCAKGDFKRTLKSIGFKVETLKGPPGKREMVRAVKLVTEAVKESTPIVESQKANG